MLSVGDIAPDFSLPDQDNKIHSRDAYHGRFVLLYFYPKDDTPGCTTQACGIRDNYSLLTKYAVILGVSSDSVGSHKKFAEKYHLPFPLLSDTDKKVIASYQAQGIFTKRFSFLISPEGKIAKVYPKVIPTQHASIILQDLEELSS